MLLPMNGHFYPYRSHVVPFTQLGKGNISVFGGSSPYSQGGNGLGGMFRGLVRTATPFLKSAAKKVGKRLLKPVWTLECKSLETSYIDGP